MLITRDNYEVYFLLYVDDELSAVERKAVENFVEENTDLKHELQVLLSTALVPEQIDFAGKENLFKSSDTFSALQEKMLLYLDKELEESEGENLKKQINQNHAARSEWEILQRVKLDSNEKIIFEHKHLLYRHKTFRVIPLRFLRVAIAAAFIGAGIFTVISFFSNKDSLPVAVNSKKEVNEIKYPASNNIRFPVVQQKIHDSLLNVKGIDPVRKEQVFSSAETVIRVTKKNKDFIYQPAKKNSVRESSFENINNRRSNEIIASGVKDQKKEMNKEDEADIQPVIASNDKAAEPVISTEQNTLTELPVSYALNTSIDGAALETNNDRVLYMNGEEFNRSRLSSVFRKVKRVIQRKTNIRTGDGIKIAGFEIAVR